MRRPTTEELFRDYGAVPASAGRAWGRRGSTSVQDATQEARIGLMEASEAADWARIEHPNQFIGFAHRHIRSMLRDMSASTDFATSGSGRSLNRAKLHSRASMDALYYQPIVDEDITGDMESLEAIRSAMRVLTDRQRTIMSLYYLDGILDDGRVADVLGITRQNVNKTRLLAEKRIKGQILEESSD